MHPKLKILLYTMPMLICLHTATAWHFGSHSTTEPDQQSNVSQTREVDKQPLETSNADQDMDAAPQSQPVNEMAENNQENAAPTEVTHTIDSNIEDKTIAAQKKPSDQQITSNTDQPGENSAPQNTTSTIIAQSNAQIMPKDDAQNDNLINHEPPPSEKIENRADLTDAADHNQYTQQQNEETEKHITGLEMQLRGLQGSVELVMHQIKLMQQQINKLQTADKKPPQHDHRNVLNADQQALALYKQGIQSIQEQQNPKATHLFVKLIKTFPKSQYVPNAYYWLGEIFYEKPQLTLALSLFEKVLHDYPQHDIAPNAAYKKGLILEQQGQLSRSLQAYNLAVKQYPDSTAARLSRLKLNQLS